MPYFWSEQFGRMVQYAGHQDPADQVVQRGDPGGQRWALGWVGRPAVLRG